MIVVTADHAAQGGFDFALHLGVGSAPTVGHVSHDEDAEVIGPVEFSGDIDLGVNALVVKAESTRPEDFIAHEGIAEEGVEAVRVVGLI